MSPHLTHLHGLCVCSAAAGLLVLTGCSSDGGPGPSPHEDTICDVQAYEADGASPLVGEIVTVRGQVTALGIPVGSSTMYVEHEFCGVFVAWTSGRALDLQLGDQVELTGIVGEAVNADVTWGPCTGVFCDSPSDISVLSTGNPEPQPVGMNISEICTEANEGRLVRAAGVVTDTDQDWLMFLEDQTGTIEVFRGNNQAVDFSVFGVGDTLQVTGVVGQHDLESPYLDNYQIIPRVQLDLVEGDALFPEWPN